MSISPVVVYRTNILVPMQEESNEYLVMHSCRFRYERDDSATHWDKANVHAFHGRYGGHLWNKVGKVFPQPMEKVL